MSAPSPPRSTFVTAVAWVFIVLAGFATLVTILQNLMITFLMPSDLWSAGPGRGPAFPPPPPGKAPLPNFDVMFKVVMGVNVVMVLAFTALFGWIMKRLVSPEIRREFAAG